MAVRKSGHSPMTTLSMAVSAALLVVACGGGNDGASDTAGGASNTPGAGSSSSSPASSSSSSSGGSAPASSSSSSTSSVPAAPPEPLVIQTFTPITGTTGGISDASTAIALDAQWMLVADDEANLIRVLPRAGGAAVAEWSYKDHGPALAKELDVEASAQLGELLFFTGSHSNKKGGGDVPAERGHFFAVKVSGSGATTALSYVGKFSDLEAQLIAWDHGNAHGLGADHFGFARSAGEGVRPEGVDGFSIEGLAAAANGGLLLGFRAPQSGATRGKALLLPLLNPEALVRGNAATASFGAPIELNLGGRGIRSIERFADGNYLIVAGPAGVSKSEVARNFALFTWSGRASDAPVELDNDLDALRRDTQGSVETIVPMGDTLAPGAQVQLLLDNGDTVWPGKSMVSKDLPPAEQQFQGAVVRLGQALADRAAPVLVSSSPADDRIGVNADSRITLNFNEGVTPGSGSFRLYKRDGSLVERIPAASLSVEFNSVSFKPSANLAHDTGYYLLADADTLRDHAGNAFTGLTDKTALDFVTAGTPTTLATGDLLFMGANAEAPDAIAFVLLKAVNGGSRITFTDRNWSASKGFAGITNEGVFVWTADRNLPAGSIVTIQTDTDGSPIADKGFTLGSPSGLGKTETIYALGAAQVASLGDGVAGEILSASGFLASITLGGKAGDIPAELGTAGTAMDFSVSPANQTNAIYKGPMDRSNLALFASLVRDPANWKVRQKPEPGYPLTNGSLFGE